MSAIVANCAINLNCELTEPVKVQYLDGNLFSMDNAGNTAHVYVYYNGQPQEIVGSVSADVIRADGSTVAVTGAMSGNRVYVIFPQAVYAVPGVLSVVIKVTEGTTTTTIAAFVANVYQSSTDTIVDPGTIIPSVDALIAAINAAVASIPVDYSALLATIATDYSPSKPYPNVGSYAWYGGVLKRSIVPITTAETYDSSHWTNAILCDDVSALKSAFDVYGAANRLPIDNGTKYSGALTIECKDGVFTASGTLTGTGETHFNIYSDNSALPSGIVPGMTIQATHECASSNVIYRLYNRVSGSNVLLCEIAGAGTKTVKVDENAVGMIIRLSYKNGSTYSSVVSKAFIFGTLTKQQTQSGMERLTNDVNDALSIKHYLPTNGNAQLFNKENCVVKNARFSSQNVLIADNNYSAVFIPVDIVSGDVFWAKIFADSVTLSEINAYTVNSTKIGTSAINASDSYGTSSKRARITANASASYFVLVVQISAGTVDDVINGLVLAKSSSAPSQYLSYYITTDAAIAYSIGSSPDCIEVGKDSNSYRFTSIEEAVQANPGSIIKVNYGAFETEVSDLATNKKIIGTDRNLCVLTGTDKDYDTPPIEIAGGIVKHFTVSMVNDESAEHKGYCIHSDNNACANNALIVEDCKFSCEGQHAIGMGIYPGESVLFRNCELIFADEEETPTHAPFFAHNSGATDGVAIVRFHNCIFRGSSYAIKLSSYSSNCIMKFEFIDCTCESDTLTGDNMIWTDYVSGDTHDQTKLHTFTGKMILLGTSHGNNVDLLNAD